MFKKILGTLVFMCWANSAYSLIDAEALYGYRWYQSKDAADANFHTSGTAYTLGLNVDPIPFVPVSIGASYMLVDLKKSDFGSPSLAQIRELGLDFKVWAGMFPYVTPYLRGRYVLASKLKVTYDNNPNANTDTDLSGFHINIGVEYRLIPLLHILLEVGQGIEEAKSFAGRKQSFNSQGVMLGLQVGI